MKKHSFKDLVLAHFPELVVRRSAESPELFEMLNQHGQTFDEKTTAYSATKSWECAYILMQRGELRPNWKAESEKSRKESQMKLEKAKLDPNWRPMSREDVSQMIKEVLHEEGLS